MGMTITEKIIAAHSGGREVRPDEFVFAGVDLCLGNDVTAPLAIKAFEELGAGGLFDPKKVVLVPDHFTPNRDIAAAEQAAVVRRFAKKHGTVYYEVGRGGIEHALLPEKGLVAPGELIVGADSHTCTYGALGAFSTGVGSTDLAACFALGKVWLRVPHSMKFVYHGRLPDWSSGKDVILYTIGDIGVEGALYRAMEFTGDAISRLLMDERLTMCNMAIEAGAKNGIIEPDEETLKYLDGRADRRFEIYRSDADAEYAEVREYDAGEIEPQVAAPNLPSNSRDVREYCDVSIDQVVIGSCTNGRINDLRVAGNVLKGKKVHPEVRLIVIPATQESYAQAVKEGLVEVFVEAGGAVSTPTCGPCLGGHMGVLAEGERALATTNRNFTGRMGHVKSEVYLSGPAVAAASAVAGKIVHPDEVVT